MEILEESIDKIIFCGIQLLVGYVLSIQEVVFGDKNIYMDVDEVFDFIFCVEGEVFVFINSGIVVFF